MTIYTKRHKVDLKKLGNAIAFVLVCAEFFALGHIVAEFIIGG